MNDLMGPYRGFEKQARDHANEVYLAPVRSKVPDKIWEEGHITWDHIFQAKFAELIVQECAKVILENPVKYNEIDALHRIRDSVKEHFGVTK